MLQRVEKCNEVKAEKRDPVTRRYRGIRIPYEYLDSAAAAAAASYRKRQNGIEESSHEGGTRRITLPPAVSGDFIPLGAERRRGPASGARDQSIFVGRVIF